MTDNELLKLLCNEPDKGLTAVVEKYSAYIYKIAYIKLRSVCSEEDIEEVVSDIFYIFYKTTARYEFKIISVKAMLAVIARRHCINVFKKHTSKPENISLEDISDTAYDKSGGTENCTFEEREQLMKAIHLLGEVDEQIFIRKYFLGQSSKEIAQDMGLKPNTVDKHVSRGLAKLKEMLKGEL